MSALDDLLKGKKTEVKTITPTKSGSALDALLKSKNQPPKVVNVSPFLGGGAYNQGKPMELITSERGYAGVQPQVGSERDHILSVALGGASTKENIELKPNDERGRQAGKVKKEQDIINRYKNKEISLAEARAELLKVQREISGIDPKQGTVNYFLPALGETVTKAGKGLANLLTSSSQAFGRTLGTAASVVDSQVNRQRNETLATNQAAIDNYLKLANEATDPIRKKIFLQAAQKLQGEIDVFTGDEYNKTGGQIAGEALGTALEATGFSTIAGKGAQAIKAGSNLAKLPAKQIIKNVAKEAGKEALTVGAPLGLGFGVSQALQEGKTGKEVAKEGAKGAVVGAGLQFGLGAGGRAVSKILPKAIEPSVVQIIDNKTGALEFKTIRKGQLKDFQNLIDDSGKGISGKEIGDKTYHLTAKSPASMEEKGFKFAGVADVSEIPKGKSNIPRKAAATKVELPKPVTAAKTSVKLPANQQAVAEDALIQEAKKYKSLDDFIKYQFNKKPQYGMSHRPSWEDMPPASNLLEGETLPRDVYDKPDFSIASGRIRSGDKAANESWSALQKIKDKPNAEITIYRAGAKNELNTGDWVTFSEDYAKQSVEGSEKVHSFKVKARDVIFAGDDINEFGYYPKSTLTEIWNKANKTTLPKPRTAETVKPSVPKKEPIKYVPEEKPVDLRKKITTKSLLGMPKASKRIEKATIEKGLIDTFGDLPDYNKTSFSEQAARVKEILDTDPNKAVRIALGQELPTNGALPESVFTAVKKQALDDGNVELLRRLATEEGGVATEASTLGQRIKMLDEGLENDPVRNITKLKQNRIKALEDKTGKKIGQLVKEETNKIKKELANVTVKKDEWESFVDSIRC